DQSRRAAIGGPREDGQYTGAMPIDAAAGARGEEIPHLDMASTEGGMIAVDGCIDDTDANVLGARAQIRLPADNAGTVAASRFAASARRLANAGRACCEIVLLARGRTVRAICVVQTEAIAWQIPTQQIARADGVEAGRGKQPHDPRMRRGLDLETKVARSGNASSA